MTTTAPATAATPAPALGRQISEQEATHKINVLRDQIDAVDDAIISLIDERIALSHNVGALRAAIGGPRLSLSRENQILGKFARAIGTHGTPLAMLLLKISRGRL
ncbi:chorismate mutase [Cumulibacter manganitolerans]|uniref:chorismate mutase n=1 Tax=Cumulibacter manganitolerans TaxID=1884992 RepID=UPI0012962322|nr:chorismate mutase [Cumulibacter manganitolerans]